MENYLENIDAYFSKTLNAEQRKEFERRVVEDKNFAQEVAFYLSAHEAAKEELAKEKKEWFRQLLKQNPPADKVKPLTPVRRIGIYRLAAAASVIGLLFLGWFLFSNEKKSPDQLATEYFNANLKTPGVEMGIPPDTLQHKDSIQQGLNLYIEGKFINAARQFESMIQRDSSDFEAIKYAGVVQLAQGNYENALSYFKRLEKLTAYSNPGKFYQALTLMKRNQPNDKESAKQLLKQVTDNKLEGSETAEQWLKKL